MRNIKGMTQDEITKAFTELGITKSYHVTQVMKWIYRRFARNFDEMTDISKQYRTILSENFYISWYEPITLLESADGTKKALFEFSDGNRAETVWIPDGNRFTLCISTQVGCKMGCRFCKTAGIGFVRNLEADEILQQVIWFCATHTVTNIVAMGMGEPLDNYDNFVRALTLLYSEKALDFSERKVTVSTCGLIPAIKKLSDESFQAALAVSLNATDNKTRSEIMPVNNAYPLEELVHELENFPMPKRRRITVEYVMFGDLNDSDTDCRRLIKICRRLRCKVNLIAYNDNSIDGFNSPTAERVRYFQEQLQNAGFTASLRKSRGQDISAACGQLYGKYGKDKNQ